MPQRRVAIVQSSSIPWIGYFDFERYAGAIAAVYDSPPGERLSDINRAVIDTLCQALGITTRITWSSEYHPAEGGNERLIDLCVKAGATEYLSGPAARGSIDEAACAAIGVSVVFADYSGYPEYPQPHPPFEHAVSALALRFCCGPRAVDFMKDVCPTRVHA